MLRTHYKPRTHHRDGYHPAASLDIVIRSNGRDLLDLDTAALAAPIVEPQTRKVADRYALMADPTARATLIAFRARQRAARRNAATSFAGAVA